MLLAIDTSGSAGSLALGRIRSSPPGRTAMEIVAESTMEGRTFSARLIPAIHDLLLGSATALDGLEAIVVVRGPGSFTGIRAGMSAAKGLCEAAQIPLIGLSRLAVLASISGIGCVLCAIEAGRGEYYAGRYREGRCLGEVLLSGAEICALARRPEAGTLIFEAPAKPGSAPPSQGAPLDACGPRLFRAPAASDALRLGQRRFLARDFDDVETLDANYIRRPDAEVPPERRAVPSR